MDWYLSNHLVQATDFHVFIFGLFIAFFCNICRKWTKILYKFIEPSHKGSNHYKDVQFPHIALKTILVNRQANLTPIKNFK